MMTSDPSRCVRFGPYEADFETQELRKHGVRIKLSGQPLQVLEILLASSGRLVTRTELQERLWPGQLYGDSSHGLNAAVKKLREALNDSASEPKYIETLPRRGYRFIGSIETNLVQQVGGPAASTAISSGVLSSVPEMIRPDSLKSAAGHVPLAAGVERRGGRPWLSLLTTAAGLFFGIIGLLAFVSKEANFSEMVQNRRSKLAGERFGSMGSRGPQTPINAATTTELQEMSDERGQKKRLAVSTHPSGDGRNGELAYVQPAMTVRRVIGGDGGNAAPQFSPDGKRLAFMSNRNGPWQIWVSEVDGSRPRQVSFTESAGTPRWSPDGGSIAFDAPFDDSTWIFAVRVDRNEKARPIVEGLVPSFSRDGRWIYYASDRTGDWQVWKTAVGRGADFQVTFHGGFAALESTDHFVYYSKSRYPQPAICRVPVLGGEESCSFQHLRPRTWASWAVTREGLVFAEDLPDGHAELSLYDPARKQVRDLVVLDSAPFWVGASTDGKKAIMNDAAERQISMVDNLR